MLHFLLKKTSIPYWTFFLYLKEGSLIKYLLYWFYFTYMHLAKIIILWEVKSKVNSEKWQWTPLKETMEQAHRSVAINEMYPFKADADLPTYVRYPFGFVCSVGLHALLVMPFLKRYVTSSYYLLNLVPCCWPFQVNELRENTENGEILTFNLKSG